ncbi:hypothetical protein ABK040_003270 [Willaertia magna]
MSQEIHTDGKQEVQQLEKKEVTTTIALTNEDISKVNSITLNPKLKANVIMKDHVTIDIKENSVKSNGSKTKTSTSYNRGFKGYVIRTRWGDFELSKTVLLSLVALFVTILGFLVINVFIFVNFFYNAERTRITRFIFKMGDLSENYSISKELVEQGVFSYDHYDHILMLYDRFNVSSTGFKNSLGSLALERFDSISFDGEFYLKTGNDIYNMQKFIFDNLYYNNSEQSISLFNSKEYNSNITQFNTLNSNLKQMMNTREKNVANVVIYISGFAFIIVIVDILVILPIIFFNFILSINTDRQFKQRLRQANTLMLTDTMRNVKIRQLFKEYCKEEKCIENFLFLERVYNYVSIAEDCEFVHFELLKSESNNSQSIEESHSSSNNENDNDGESVNNNTNAISHTIIQDKKKKQRIKKNFTQDDLKEYENKKYSEAFQIYTDFLELEGQYAINVNKKGIERVKLILDQFNLKQIESLPILLFEDLEQEIAYLLIDTHKRFKQSSLFKEAMKINRKSSLHPHSKK